MTADDPREILVIHPGALGDVLQTVPALRSLGRGARLTFGGQPRLGGLLCGAGVVHAAMGFDGLGLEAFFTREPAPPSLVARLARFDRVVSWFGASDDIYPERLRTLVPGCVIAAPTPEGATAVSVWEHLRRTLGLPEAAPADLAPLTLPPAWRDEARRALAELGVRPGVPSLFVHPGAGAQWKLWPPEAFARVIQETTQEIDGEVLVHQGPADREATDQLLSLLDTPALRLVEPELPLLAGVLGETRAYLGGDSGVSHLAAAVGAAAVILFPAATRERWQPWSPTALALEMDGRLDLAATVTAVSERLRGKPAASRPSSRASPSAP